MDELYWVTDYKYYDDVPSTIDKDFKTSGLLLRLRSNDGKTEMERFLSTDDLSLIIFGKSMKMSKKNIELFGEQLKRSPIVELENTKRPLPNPLKVKLPNQPKLLESQQELDQYWEQSPKFRLKEPKARQTRYPKAVNQYKTSLQQSPLKLIVPLPNLPAGSLIYQ